MLKVIVADMERSGHLTDLRLVIACLLGFAGFMHFDELINLWPCNFDTQTSMMSVRMA